MNGSFPKQGVSIWGFPKIRCIFLEVPIIRTVLFWGLYWGTLILGNYHINLIGPQHSLVLTKGNRPQKRDS